jgi:DNA replication and repair protein RecF
MEYAAALAQRNGGLRRLGAGYSSREALEPWTERVAELGKRLVDARRELVTLVSSSYAAAAADLRLEGGELRYEGAAASWDELERRLEQDLARGSTGLGPHLHDVAVLAGGRDLRSFGSQGEQRLAVLALLLAEADLLIQRGNGPPLLLFDDVLSELDPDRRGSLVERLRRVGAQTLVTATSASALPGAPDELIEVRPGQARRAA